MNEKNISEIRKNYTKSELTDELAGENPYSLFQKWLNEAIDSELPEPTAFTLCTVTLQGKPNARVLLLKGLENELFKFYTNYQSRKGQELELNPYACMVFFWPELERQIRIEGKVSKLSKEESERYFQSRPRESQIGAYASKQSQILESRELLEKEFQNWKKKFEQNETIPIPEYWGGYALHPNLMEFWQGRPNRLHDRIQFVLYSNEWKKFRLYP